MIDKNVVRSLVEEWLKDKEYFLVDVEISADDKIVVEIDHADGVWIEDCVQLSRYIEDHLSRDEEDYELEVGSAGLGQPFKVPQQYENYVGKEVEVLVASNYKSYDFNTDGNNEGWTANSVLGTAIVENGAYYLLSDTPNGTRYDPQLTLIETFNGSDYSKCIVTYKYDFGNATKDYQATLFAWGNGDTVLSKDVMPATNVSEEYVTVIFDLSSWDGHTITKIRFDVCECAGTAYIDSIVFAG